jgi:hypothetical protein
MTMTMPATVALSKLIGRGASNAANRVARDRADGEGPRHLASRVVIAQTVKVLVI